MTNYVNNWITKKMIELREEFGGECKVCGSKENLEFAHLVPTDLSGSGRGRKERYYDIKKNRHCYTLLCRIHHRLVDKILKEKTISEGMGIYHTRS